ncbi:endomucin [Sciurus carolinensis]|uniref:endomucin n=1 Tax=Sciurus carolinensis TaxID=30640 RepID=UPI001FB5339C|nr:endomucin [Sciurus carolinensis]
MGTMQLLQVTTLFLLFSLCSCENNTDVSATLTTASSSTVSTMEKPVLTAKTVSPPNSDTELSAETSPNGTTNSELSNTSPVPEIVASLTTAKSEETTTQNVTKSELVTTKGTVTNPPLSNATSTTQSSQNETESQSSIKTSTIPVSTQKPDASPSKTTILSSTSITSSSYISPQGTEDEKYANSSSTSPSYSSIILPVVIALIVITLSVFVVVGLYRMCWKTDPGTPENGNDQPQSDKESVKLLTVKTISNESGEHSAQGKTKN